MNLMQPMFIELITPWAEQLFGAKLHKRRVPDMW